MKEPRRKIEIGDNLYEVLWIAIVFGAMTLMAIFGH